MDWRSISFDWNRARAFLITAEEGSLSAAARALDMTQPTLGRQVSALEKELGVALFERSGRGLKLTPSGLELIEHVRAMGDAANSLSLAATGKAESLEGSICITATEVMAVFGLPPIIAKLRNRHPGITIELIASNTTSDLKRREADIAIRAFRPTQPDLIARRLRDFKFHLYAAERYLDRLGNPTTLDGFSKADFFGFDHSDQLQTMLNDLGFNLTAANFPIITAQNMAQWEMIKNGLGLGFMQIEIGDAEPGVARVLPDLEMPLVEMWLVAHRELRTSRRLRVVFDLLAAELS